MSKNHRKTPTHSQKKRNGTHEFDRREFIQASAAAMAIASASKIGMMTKTAHAKSLSDIIVAGEADVYYRNRLPDDQTPFTNDAAQDVSLFDWNFPDIVRSATNGEFGRQGMPSSFSTYYQIPTQYLGMPVAIIGAGAAGLATGYEMMKLGLKPVFYEMQTETTGTGSSLKLHARPFGRIYSWDFGGHAYLEPGSGWHPQKTLTPDTTKPDTNINTHLWGRRVAELGGMRFPATHLTLRTYTDAIFPGDYYYGTKVTNPWVPFRDPGLYTPTNSPDPERGGVVAPDTQDKIKFATAYHTKGIFVDATSPNPPKPGVYSELSRIEAGKTLGESNAAIANLTNVYFDFLYGDNGVLTPILELYSQYTESATPTTRDAIIQEWEALVKTYDTKSLREVLIDAGWGDMPAYGDAGWGAQSISLLEMFGEIGTGTGPFAMFYYSSFVELLRIALQAADSNQDYFLGGAGYQLQPFLTHFTPTRNSATPTCMWNETQNNVITDKVVAIEKVNPDGIRVTTQDANNARNSIVYALVVLTAGPAAMRATDIFPNPDEFIPSRALSYIKRVRINNNSKIAINFPNVPEEPNSKAFWMNRDGNADPNDPNADKIVTTLTDKTIRQIYTFDNYHWGTEVIKDAGSLNESGILMLNYGWDYNAQSWTADERDNAALKAWRQMTDIYGFGTQYDDYLDWAIKNKQVAFIVWEKVDGFNAAWRMAQPGRDTKYGDPNEAALYSEFQTMQTFGMTSYNPETKAYTGLFLAGEASASPGLSGWVEGSIQTGLQAVAGIVKYLNDVEPRKVTPPAPNTGISFAMHAHPGRTPLDHSN